MFGGGDDAMNVPLTPLDDVKSPLSTKFPSTDFSYVPEQNVLRPPTCSNQNITLPTPLQRPVIVATPS